MENEGINNPLPTKQNKCLKSIPQSINGFSKNEVFVFYKFIVVYENEIRKRKVEEIEIKYPQLKKEIKKIFNKINFIKVVDNEDYIKIKNTPNSNLWYSNRKSVFFKEILGHIRNSIAHANIKIHNKDIYLEDYNIYKKKYTSIAFIDKEVLFKTINLLA